MARAIHLVLLVAVAVVVFLLTRAAYRPAEAGPRVEATVLLERVRPVLKLVTVEGDFSELYTYRTSDAAFDWMKRFSPFQKRAILRVKGRASVGYDLEALGLRIDEERRTVTLTGLGPAKLLALEHDVDYFDLEAGSFTAFTAADHSRINAEAKELIRGKVPASGLYQAAEARRGELVTVLRALVENAGWRFVDGTEGAASERPIPN